MTITRSLESKVDLQNSHKTVDQLDAKASSAVGKNTEEEGTIAVQGKVELFLNSWEYIEPQDPTLH